MHSPPSVSYPVGRSHAADRLVAAVWTSGAAWAGLASVRPVVEGTSGWRALLLCLVVLMAGLSSWRFQQRAIRGMLTFDLGQWTLSRDAGAVVATGPARICLDFQRLALIRIDVDGRRNGRWLWVDCDADRARWRDLRRALYAETDASDRSASLRGQGALSA